MVVLGRLHWPCRRSVNNSFHHINNNADVARSYCPPNLIHLTAVWSGSAVFGELYFSPSEGFADLRTQANPKRNYRGFDWRRLIIGDHPAKCIVWINAPSNHCLLIWISASRLSIREVFSPRVYSTGRLDLKMHHLYSRFFDPSSTDLWMGFMTAR